MKISNKEIEELAILEEDAVHRYCNSSDRLRRNLNEIMDADKDRYICFRIFSQRFTIFF